MTQLPFGTSFALYPANWVLRKFFPVYAILAWIRDTHPKQEDMLRIEHKADGEISVIPRTKIFLAHSADSSGWHGRKDATSIVRHPVDKNIQGGMSCH